MTSRTQRYTLLTLVFFFVALLSMWIGSSQLGFFSWDSPISQLRLTRLLLATTVGAGLGLSGLVFQAILRNPLADPYIIGLSGGAALGAVSAAAIGITSVLIQPIMAFLGAATVVSSLYTLARKMGRSDPLTLLLLGVILNAFTAAIVTFIKVTLPARDIQSLMFWLVGHIQSESLLSLSPLLLLSLLGTLGIFFHSGALNLISLDDDTATGLGLNVESARRKLFYFAAVIVAASVSMCGMIGFVGLVVPHIVRRLFGAEHRALILPTLLIGAIALLCADIISRLGLLFWGTQAPVGAITALLGAPFFVWVLLKK